MNPDSPSIGRAERELLVTCARLELSDGGLERTSELLQRKLDWNQILLFAEAHSVAPLLYRHLQELDGWAAVPPEPRQRLLQLTHRTSYRNRLYSAALAELLTAFARGGVPVMVLKGLSLVELVYGDLALRPLIDHNLLIPKSHLKTARALLLQGGYVETLSRGSPFYRWTHSQLVLEKPGSFRVSLMLQWDVVSWPRIQAIDLARVWSEAQPVRLSGQETRIPSSIDFALYLCLQADKYAFLNAAAIHLREPAEFVFDERTFNRLIRFTDLHEVIRHYQERIDWEELIARGRSAGIGDSVYRSLHCVERLFGTPGVRPALAALRPASPPRLRRWLYRGLLAPATPGTAPAFDRSMSRWWQQQDPVTQRRWIKLANLVEFVFPRRDILSRRHERTWGKAAALAYPIHVAGAMLRCALHLPLWIYYRVRALRSRRLLLDRATPGLRPPALSDQGATRS
jgi:hypothetical protein